MKPLKKVGFMKQVCCLCLHVYNVVQSCQNLNKMKGDVGISGDQGKEKKRNASIKIRSVNVFPLFLLDMLTNIYLFFLQKASDFIQELLDRVRQLESM